MGIKLSVSHEFVGYSDYWGGNGRRWDNNAGCAFAFYNDRTTLRDCVEQWVDDWGMGGDFEHNGDGRDPWEDVTDDDIRAAILDSLTEQGRADYETDALAECAADYEVEWESAAADDEYVDIGDEVKIDNVDGGDAFGEIAKISYDDDGAIRSIFVDVDGKWYRRDPENVYYRADDDDYSESPVWIILIEIEQCSECGAGDEHVIDDICAACADKHGYAV